MTQAFNSSPLARKLVRAILFAPWDLGGQKTKKPQTKKHIVLILGFGKESYVVLAVGGIKTARAPHRAKLFLYSSARDHPWRVASAAAAHDEHGFRHHLLRRRSIRRILISRNSTRLDEIMRRKKGPCASVYSAVPN